MPSRHFLVPKRHSRLPERRRHLPSLPHGDDLIDAVREIHRGVGGVEMDDWRCPTSRLLTGSRIRAPEEGDDHIPQVHGWHLGGDRRSWLIVRLVEQGNQVHGPRPGHHRPDSGAAIERTSPERPEQRRQVASRRPPQGSDLARVHPEVTRMRPNPGHGLPHVVDGCGVWGVERRPVTDGESHEPLFGEVLGNVRLPGLVHVDPPPSRDDDHGRVGAPASGNVGVQEEVDSPRRSVPNVPPYPDLARLGLRRRRNGQNQGYETEHRERRSPVHLAASCRSPRSQRRGVAHLRR
jgi:hypothetical protein